MQEENPRFPSQLQHSQSMLDADLCSALVELLDLDHAEVETNPNSTFVQLGGNSVKALELTFKLDAVGKSLDVETILGEGKSISSLSQTLLGQDSPDEALSPSSPSRQNGVESLQEIQPNQSDNKTYLTSIIVREAGQKIGCSEDDIEDVLPLTSQQSGLWFGSLQVSCAYISHWLFGLDNTIDLTRLDNAWQQVITLNPILRTRILSLADSKLYQVVLTAGFHEARPQLLHVDNVTPDEGTPLFGFNVSAKAESKDLNVYCHHALYDRWSMRLIFQDVQYVYQYNAIPPSRPSYIPFLQLFSKTDLESLKDMWLAVVQGKTVTPAPALDTIQRSALASNVYEITLVSNAVGDFTAAEILSAAWSLVCSKHCNSKCVSFGLTVWGRDIPLPGITHMAFPTFKTMPLVAEICETDTIESFLTHIRSRLSLVRRTQLLDVDIISSLHSVCRDACRFNSILVIQQDLATVQSENEIFDASHLLLFETKQSTPLVLECVPAGKEIVCKMKYDTAFISSVGAETMINHLKTAFDRLSSGSNASLNDISLFNDQDLRLIHNWIAPSLTVERATLHDLVEESARVRRDTLAIWQTNLSLTYGDLIDKSRAIKAKIVLMNRKTCSNVGVCFEKSAYAVVAMLGVSMSGCAFVPMDISNPFNRLMQLVEDADITLVICSPLMSPKFREAKIEVLVVDNQTPLTPTDEGPAASSNPASNAYIMYTSGSTGKPKGVVMTHQALCTTLKAISNHLEFDSDTRTLQFSSFAFDMSVHDIWPTLLMGGVLCMPTDAERFDLEDFVLRSECNYAMLTPSVALTLADDVWKSFKKLCVGGEPIRQANYTKTLEAGVKVWNIYGPTETCVICLTELVQRVDANPSILGHSMAATSWIIDADDPHRLAPVGCIGELALSGPTLATGYYRDLQKTEQAFRAGLEWTRLFPDYSLDKVYRTGDLVRYQSDGSIEFQGRMGGYVKIAGNRVDLREIEHVLHNGCKLPKTSVQYCQVGTSETRDMLISFSAFPAKGTNQVEVLSMTTEMKGNITKAFTKLKQLLPSYMIPAILIPVSRFPYNTSGKLDRECLISLVADKNVDDLLAGYAIDMQTFESSTAVPGVQELSSDVLTMRESWAAVLMTAMDNISLHSNFFRLGGDSLRAMNLRAHIRQLGYAISVADVFRHPLLEEMAGRMTKVSSKDSNVLSKEIWSVEETYRVTIAAAKKLGLSTEQIESILPCTSLQTQMLAASVRSPTTYMHRQCFELAADIAITEVIQVCQSLTNNNELLRSKVFVDQNTGQFVLTVLKSSEPAPLSRVEASLEHYLETAQNPVGVAQDLVRFVLLEDGPRRTLVWEMHHSIYDGYSEALLVRQTKDIVQACRRSNVKHTSDLPNLPTFKSFVQYLNAAERPRAVKFWSDYLRDAPQPDPVFIAKSNGHNRATNARVSHQLDIKEFKSQYTMANYIRTAFALVLSQYTTSMDVVFAATNHGRDLPVDGIDRLVGPAFSTLPVRCMIDLDETLGTLLSRLQVEAAEVASYQYLSTEEISSIDSSCRQACRFVMHLLVQPVAGESLLGELDHLGYHPVPNTSPMQLQIPFNLVAMPKKDSVLFDVIYNDLLFPSGQVDRFFDQFAANLTAILTNHESVRVGDIHGLSPVNRDAYLAIQPTDANQDKYAGLTIPQLVFRHLKVGPGNQAIYSTKASFTYEEVYAIATAISKDITGRVNGPDCRYIALCLEKSPMAVIAQLAVLMAGHAYVSMDSSWPAARIQIVLAQMDCPLLISSTGVEGALQEVTTPILTLGGEGVSKAGVECKKPLSKARPEDAAYVIFTSGTTGVPKGVVVQHDAICRTLCTYAERLKFTTQTRALLFASFSFDASVMETWSILAAGGTLCIADDTERIHDLDAFLHRSKAECVGVTPTTARLLDPQRHDTLKTLLFCGEKCQPSDLERWSRPGLTIVNAYGPSETSVNAVMNTRFSKTNVSNIGYGMGGGLWIADPTDHHRLVPAGGIGELLVTGPVLAKEYLNDAKSTAQKFVYPQWPSWTNTAGQRAYKTGDLVQLDLDGALHFIGRHDGQMKVNGIRIEADEVEHAIRQAKAGVSEAAVGLCATTDDDRELAVFFVPSPGTDRPTSEAHILPLERSHHTVLTQIHAYLISVLPQSHVPGLFVPVSGIPSSASGKTGRKTLCQALTLLHPAQLDLYRPRARQQRSRSDETTTPTPSPGQKHDDGIPLTPTESKLISLWTRVLHHQHTNSNSDSSSSSSSPIHRHSHFIRTGGNSVSAIRLSALAETAEGLKLPVSLIYAHPELADMAAAVDRSRGEDDNVFADLVSPQPFELLDGLDLSPLVSRHDDGAEGTDYFAPKTRWS